METTTPVLKKRQLRLNIRLTPGEWDKIHKLASNTTCRSVSDYSRKVLAQQPVKVFYRNRSFDEFEEQMTGFLAQLERFGDNYEQAVRKLSSPDRTLEMKAILSELLKWNYSFSATVTAIREQIENLSDKCDQK